MITQHDDMKPKALLRIYESDAPENKSSKIYVEMHEINQKGQVLAGKPLTPEFSRSFGKALFKSSSAIAKGRVPRNLLKIEWYNDKPVLTWWTPLQKVKTYYTKNLNIADQGTIEVPPLVWQYSMDERNLEIFAFKENTEPNEKTELFFAPFHNVYTNGTVCIGSGSSKLQQLNNFTDIMENAMKVFWSTKFSEIHNKTAIDGNLNTLHKSLVNGASFPMDKLMPIHNKLNLD